MNNICKLLFDQVALNFVSNTLTEEEKHSSRECTPINHVSILYIIVKLDAKILCLMSATWSFIYTRPL